MDERYRRLLVDIDGVALLTPGSAGLESSHHLFVIVLDRELDREAFRGAVAGRGIQTSVHYPPVHHFSIYRDRAPQLPVTDDYARRTVSLPMFAHMTEDQQDLVVAAVEGAVRTVAH